MKKVGYILVAFVGLTLTVQATTVTWDGGGGGARSWMEALNWNPDGVPLAGNDYTASSGTIDAKLANFSGDSLTLTAAILRYVDESNSWGIDIITNSAGIIRNQNIGFNVSGSIANLMLAGTARFLVDNAASSLALDIGTLTLASAADPYYSGAGALTLNIGSINAPNGEVFRISGGVVDLDGAADTQVIGLNITAGQYVLDEARSFASLAIAGTTIVAGTYSFGDFTVAQQAYLSDAGGSITVIPEPATLGLVGLVFAMLLGVRRIFLMG